MGKSAPKPPAAPDPNVTAAAQTASNQATAQYQSVLNNANQVTPYGNLTYSQDPSGQWTATQTFSPQEAANYALSTQAQNIYGNAAVNQLGAAQQSLSTPMGTPASPYAAYNQYQAAASQPLNTNYSDVANQYIKSQYQLQQPQWDQQRQDMQAQLANQGVPQGSPAWNTAMNQTEQSISNAQAGILSNATANTGQAIQQALNLRQEPLTEATQGANLLGTGLQQAAGLQQMPLNEASALLSGSQVQSPNFVNPSQTQVASTNVLGAYGLQQQAQDLAYQSQLQQYQGAMGGMGSLAGTLGAAGIMAFSDKRLKTDVREVGSLKQLGGKSVPLKTFRFRGSPVRRLGVIAQDVEPVTPGAVATHPATGLKSVDYAHLLLASHHAAMQGRKRA